MNYEYLIRRAYQCGRNGADGTNADIFRKFERAASHYFTEKKAIENKTERKWLGSEDELFDNYMQGAGEIGYYMESAISLVKNKYSEKLNKEQSKELDNIKALLITHDFDKIIEAIERGEKVMLDIGLYPQ